MDYTPSSSLPPFTYPPPLTPPTPPFLSSSSSPSSTNESRDYTSSEFGPYRNRRRSSSIASSASSSVYGGSENGGTSRDQSYPNSPLVRPSTSLPALDDFFASGWGIGSSSKPGNRKKEVEDDGKQRRYRCFECGNSFTTSGHLTRHRRLHSDSKRHDCLLPECEQTFNRKDNMIQHFRTHANMKSRTRLKISQEEMKALLPLAASGTSSSIATRPRRNTSSGASSCIDDEREEEGIEAVFAPSVFRDGHGSKGRKKEIEGDLYRLDTAPDPSPSAVWTAANTETGISPIHATSDPAHERQFEDGVRREPPSSFVHIEESLPPFASFLDHDGESASSFPFEYQYSPSSSSASSAPSSLILYDHSTRYSSSSSIFAFDPSIPSHFADRKSSFEHPSSLEGSYRQDVQRARERQRSVGGSYRSPTDSETSIPHYTLPNLTTFPSQSEQHPIRTSQAQATIESLVEDHVRHGLRSSFTSSTSNHEDPYERNSSDGTLLSHNTLWHPRPFRPLSTHLQLPLDVDFEKELSHKQ